MPFLFLNWDQLSQWSFPKGSFLGDLHKVALLEWLRKKWVIFVQSLLAVSVLHMSTEAEGLALLQHVVLPLPTPYAVGTRNRGHIGVARVVEMWIR